MLFMSFIQIVRLKRKNSMIPKNIREDLQLPVSNNCWLFSSLRYFFVEYIIHIYYRPFISNYVIYIGLSLLASNMKEDGLHVFYFAFYACI